MHPVPRAVTLATVAAAALSIAPAAFAAPPRLLSANLMHVSTATNAERSCAVRRSSGAAVQIRSLTAPATGAVSVRTSGRRSSDWDVGLVDRATGNVLNGAAARGSSDHFEVLVAKGQRLALQSCRLSGTGGLNIRVRFARAATGGSTGTVRMARVNLATRLDADRLAALGLDATDHAGDRHQDVLLHSRADEQRLRGAGFTYRVVQADQLRHDAANRRREARAQARVMAARRLGPARAAQAASALPSGRASYRTLANINDELRALAQANPNLVRLFSIGTSRLGKPIQGIEIATKVGAADGRPGYVQMGVHHAREWPSDEAALEFGYELINAVTGTSNRPAADIDRLRQIAGEARTYVIPVLNVDGFDVTTETEGLNPDGSYVDPVDSPGSSGNQAIGSGAYKRKTCYDPDPALQAIPCILRTTNHATPDPTDVPGNYPDRGVDPNRNYGPFWGGPGTSDATADLTNAGPRPFSEPETEAFRRWSRDRNLTVVIGNHTFTGLILRPPGTGDQGPTPDEFRLRLLGDAMARQVDYISQYGYQLYDTTGTLDDYVYDALGAFAYTPEIGKEEFHPAYEDVIAEYDGPPQLDANGAPTGQNLLGLREAYIAAGLAAFNTGQYSETPPSPGSDPLAFERERVTTGIPQTHGVLNGTAPAGRTLRLQSAISYTTATNPNDDGVLHPVQTISEQRNLTLGLASGAFTWHVPASSQPRSGATTPWLLTCEGPGGVLEQRFVYVARGQTVNLGLACGTGGTPTNPAPTGPECTDPDGFRRVNATRRGTGLRISFSRKVRNPVRIQIHRVSTTKTRRIKTTLIKRWRNKTRSFTWNGKPRRGVTVEPGIYTVRFQIRDAGAGWTRAVW